MSQRKTMGRDITLLKIIPQSDLPPQASATQQTPEQRIRTYLESDTSLNFNYEFTSHGVCLISYSTRMDIHNYVCDVLELFPSDFVSKIVVLQYSDSTQAGSGCVFEVTETNTLEQIYQCSGYENARAFDVKGNIQDETGITLPNHLHFF